MLTKNEIYRPFCTEFELLKETDLEHIRGGMMHRPQLIPGHLPCPSSPWRGPQGHSAQSVGPASKIIVDTLKGELASRTIATGIDAAKAVKTWMNNNLHDSKIPVADRMHRWLN